LLRALAANEKICSSVVTGNFEATAEIKLETAGLAPYLRRGAYASDSHVRPDLPAIAKARCERITGSTLLAEQCIIIGDTPNDLQAARQNHMKCILVGTGRYPIEELRYFEPDGCLADLADTDAVVEVLAKIYRSNEYFNVAYWSSRQIPLLSPFDKGGREEFFFRNLASA